MTDSRSRFEAWWDATDFTNSGPWAHDTPIQWAWDAWQAATAAADADLTQSVQMYVDAARERDEAIAAEIKAEADKWAAVRACVDVINCYSYVGDRSKEMLVAVKAEFPEAFK